jgi:hypothetical protein
MPVIEQVQYSRISIPQIVSIMILVFILLAPKNVLAGSYDETFFIFSAQDQQHRHFMDLEVSYSSPDSVTPGSPITVDVTITYLQNSNASFSWVEVKGIIVSLRQTPKGNDLAAEGDSSTTRLSPGQQYNHKFNVDAPQATGQYYLIMHWATNTPSAHAYGYTLSAGAMTWDIGGGNLDYGAYGEAPMVSVQPTTTASVASTTATTSSTSVSTSVSTTPPVTLSSTTPTSSGEIQSFSLGNNGALLLGAVAGIAIVVIGAYISMKHRAGTSKRQTLAPPQPKPMAPVPATTGPPSKFCIHCGQAIPANARFCPHINCGKPQQ